jgi:predicted dithiol-disulfide oxidoreductase (DUF899 family)
MQHQADAPHEIVSREGSSGCRSIPQVLARSWDRAPKGRNEDGTVDFVRRYDEYDDAKPQSCCAGSAG